MQFDSETMRAKFELEFGLGAAMLSDEIVPTAPVAPKADLVLSSWGNYHLGTVLGSLVMTAGARGSEVDANRVEGDVSYLRLADAIGSSIRYTGGDVSLYDAWSGDHLHDYVRGGVDISRSAYFGFEAGVVLDGVNVSGSGNFDLVLGYTPFYEANTNHAKADIDTVYDVEQGGYTNFTEIEHLVRSLFVDEGEDNAFAIEQAGTSLSAVSILVGEDAENTTITIEEGPVFFHDEGEGTRGRLGDDTDDLYATGVDGTFALGGGDDYAFIDTLWGTTVVNGEGGNDNLNVRGGGDTIIFGGTGFDDVRYEVGKEGGEHYVTGVERIELHLGLGVDVDADRIDFATTGGADGRIEFDVADGETFRLTIGSTGGDDSIFG